MSIGFRIVGLKESILIVIKAISETHIAGGLKEEIINSIEDFNAIDIKIRVVM